jgi:Holliday junction resolvasome RuvABC endonuclease subunit
MTARRILAFDLGKNMAWAFSDGITVDCGHWTAPAGTRGHRFFKTCAWIADTIKHFRPTVIVFERPFTRGLAATRVLWGVAALIETMADAAELPCVDVVPGQIKKWATGNGAADKEAMMAAAHDMLYFGDNEHEADAYCLAKFAETELTT